jgi:outer membrane protein assembly factor BamB
MSDVSDPKSSVQPAEIVHEYGPYEGAPAVHGVTYDGERVWFASGDKLRAIDPSSGELVRSVEVECDAGTAFDGKHIYQVAGGQIHRIDSESGRVLSSIPAPGDIDATGLTWAEGALWVGQFRGRKILKIDPNSGAVLRTLESDRFVTGVTFAQGELWHGTGEDGQPNELRQLDAESGSVKKRLQMPVGVAISGIESNGKDLLYCGGGESGRVRAVRRPKNG